MKEYLPVLKQSSLFGQIEEDKLLAMLNCLSVTTKEYKQGEILFHVGDKISKIGFLLNGRIQLEQEDLNGNRTILDQILPGSLFAEAIVCSGISTLPICIIAKKASTIMYMDYEKILRTCSNACTFHTSLIQNMITILAKRNVNLTDKLNHLSKRSTREKLLSYLQSQSISHQSNSFEIPYNRQELADYLCVERSAMSTELSKLKKEGLINYQKNIFSMNRKILS